MLRVYNVCFGWVYKPKRYLGLVITMVVMIYIYTCTLELKSWKQPMYMHTHILFMHCHDQFYSCEDSKIIDENQMKDDILLLLIGI